MVFDVQERMVCLASIESDAINLVNVVQGSNIFLASYVVLIDEIRSLMGLLQVRGLSYVPRGINKVAHNLAGATL